MGENKPIAAKSKKTRHSIVLESIKLIARDGVKECSSGRLAQSLGLAPSHVFYYFPKMSDLYSEILTHIVETNVTYVAAKFLKASSPFEQLKIYLSGNLGWSFSQPDHVATLLTFAAGSDENSKLSLLTREVLNTGEQKIYQLICQGLIENDFSSVLPPKELATLIHQLLTGTIVCEFTNGSKPKRKAQANSRLLGTLKLILNKP